MKSLILCATLCIAHTCFAGLYDTIPANNPKIEYTGRIDFSNAERPVFSYSGVSVRACFTGASIAMIMDDDIGQNYYNVLLDGKLISLIQITKGKKTYEIANGLPDVVHEVELFKRTELVFGKTKFYGFLVDQGDSLTEILNHRNYFIEYIGNSITCGYGNEGTSADIFGPTTENHFMSYAALTSRNFNARHMAVSRSGIGVYRNYGESNSGSADCMSNNYTRIFLYDEQPVYAFQQTPDIVCINLGTNDFSTNGGDSALYVRNYFRLIDTIQSKYNQPDIICLLGPMITEPTLTKVRKYIHFIADSANQKNKGNVHFFELSTQSGPYGVDYHPTVAQHIMNSLELTGFIKSIKGWNIKPMVMLSELSSGKSIQLKFNTKIQDTETQFNGFSITDTNNNVLPIERVYLDAQDSALLNVNLVTRLTGGEPVILNYLPSTIESTDLLPLESFSSLVITNTFSASKVLSARTNELGNQITFVFNKKLGDIESIDGLTIFNLNNNLPIDSFLISDKQLVTYIHQPIIPDDSIFATFDGKNIFTNNDIVISPFNRLVVKNNLSSIAYEETDVDFITIYPNPNMDGNFYYIIDSSNQNEVKRIELINSEGKVIVSNKIQKSKGVLHTGYKLNQGIYFVRIITIAKSFYKKVIVK